MRNISAGIKNMDKDYALTALANFATKQLKLKIISGTNSLDLCERLVFMAGHWLIGNQLLRKLCVYHLFQLARNSHIFNGRIFRGFVSNKLKALKL